MRSPAAAFLAVLALALTAAVPAAGEQEQRGDLIVSLDGGISPLRLPRDTPAPVFLELSGTVRTADGAPLPRVSVLELALGIGGVIDTEGLPVCRRDQLAATSPRSALAICGPALVGHGRLEIEIFIPGQIPFEYKASLLAFNGRGPGGRRLIWLHVYGTEPPATFLLRFQIRPGNGEFGTVLTARVPRDLHDLPHLARFELTIGRRFADDGERHGYLSADCALPPRFDAGLSSFARAGYRFADGQRISTTIIRGCRVRPTGISQRPGHRGSDGRTPPRPYGMGGMGVTTPRTEWSFSTRTPSTSCAWRLSASPTPPLRGRATPRGTPAASHGPGSRGCR